MCSFIRYTYCVQENNLDTFINSLLDKRGYKDAAPEVREALYADVLERINQFVLAKVIASLSEEELTEFEKLLDEKKPLIEFQEFAQKHVPDYTTFLAAVLLEFEDIYLGA